MEQRLWCQHFGPETKGQSMGSHHMNVTQWK